MSTTQQQPPDGVDRGEPEFIDIECTFCGTHLYGLTKADAFGAMIGHHCAERDFDKWISKPLPEKEQLARTIANRGGWRRIEDPS